MSNFSFKNLNHSAKMSLIIIAGIVVGLLFSFNISAVDQSEPDVNVKAVHILPKGEAKTESNITVRFSRLMVPKDSLDKPLLEHPLIFNPPIPGIARWIEQDVLRFFPDNGLAPATSYELKIKSDKTFLFGNKINDDNVYRFNTPYLDLQSFHSSMLTSLEDSEKGYFVIDLTFNYEVNLEWITTNTKIAGLLNNTSTQLRFKVENSGQKNKTPGFARNIRIISDTFIINDQEQTYQLQIRKGLPCYKCGEASQKDVTRKLIANQRKRLSIERVDSRIYGSYGSIYIYTSQKVSSADAIEYISVDPKVEFTIENGYRNLILQGQFEAGKSYTVYIKKGLRANDGSVIDSDFSTMTTIPNLTPSVKFISNNIYLPKKENKFIELETVNVDELSVEVDRIFQNNLTYALASNIGVNSYYRDISTVGKTYFGKDKKLEGQPNQKLTTTVDMGAIIGENQKGIYIISAYNKNYRWTSDSRLVMLTDMGIVARYADDYLMVWVNSLSETEPVKNARIQLISRNNQVLLEGKTDSKGLAVFENITERTDGFTPYLITAELDDDLTYLKFDDCLLPVSDFDVKGRPYLSKGYEAFLYTERGVYRPGETIHLSSLVRRYSGEAPEEFPYFIIINDPSGKEFKSFRVNSDNDGFLSLDIDIPSFAQTGIYNVHARIGEDYTIGKTSLQIEEFMPDKIKVSVKTDKTEYNPGEKIKINVSGKHLFGPPTKGYNVTGDITLENHFFSPQGYSEFSFHNSELTFSKIKYDLAQNKLDDNGEFQYSYDIPTGLKPPSDLKALISTGVSEQGGRMVNDYTEIIVHPYQSYLGLRLDFEGYADPGSEIQATVVSINNDGTSSTADSVLAVFYKEIYNTVLRQTGNTYQYVSEKKLTVVDSVHVNVSAAGSPLNFTPPTYGSYLLVVKNSKTGHSASQSFYASGWGYSPWSMKSPDRIEIDLDFTEYKIGDKAKVQIRSPFGGKLLLTVEKDKIYEFYAVEMDSNTAEIVLPVKKEYFPNAYISVTVIKKAGQIDKTSPARAFGIAPFKLSKQSKNNKLTINSPKKVKPNSKVEIHIQADSLKASQITVAAVDEGILQLTGYETPDPLEFFYGQRRSYFSMYDNYGYIYPEVERAKSHLSPAGGVELFESKMKRHVNPISAKRVKSIVLWSGIVTTDQNGKAVVSFDIPEFNGNLKIMAVAVNEDRYGSTTSNMLVRDDFVIQESFPRFTTPNDFIEGLVTIFNNTERSTEIEVTLETEGPLELMTPKTQSHFVDKDSETNLIYKFSTGFKPGKMSFKIRAKAGQNESEINFEIPNRPGQPLLSEYGMGVLVDTDSVSFTLPDKWLEGTDLSTINLSSLAGVSYTKNINFLIQYPYGCLEQTTSRLFPLLRFEELAGIVKPEMLGLKGADYFIQEGIIKLTSMMMSDGRFSFWPNGDYVNDWSSIYASHFLLEAKEKGFRLDNSLYNIILNKLKKNARGQFNESKNTYAEQIYAAYALAKVNKMENKILNSLRDIPVQRLSNFSKYQLAVIFALNDDIETARSLVPSNIVPESYDPDDGGYFNSSVRTNALLLDALINIDPHHPSALVIAKSLSDEARVGHWYTTQSTAWALMILGDFYKNKKQPDFTGSMTIENDSTYRFDQKGFNLISENISGAKVDISIAGEGDCYFFWQSNGVPVSNEPREFTNGIYIKRTYLNDRGDTLDLKNVQLGEQVICHIQAEALDKNLSNVVINDLLPAGMEIENPRLKTTPRLSWVPRNDAAVSYQDIRDDRLLLFIDLNLKQKFDYYYSLRVISAGEFKIPPIAAECMYNPLIAGASSSGVMIVKSSQNDSE